MMTREKKYPQFLSTRKYSYLFSTIKRVKLPLSNGNDHNTKVNSLLARCTNYTEMEEFVIDLQNKKI